MSNKLLAEYISEKDALLGFVDSMKKAAGFAHALGHYQSNPNWLKVRDMLEITIEQGQKMFFAKAMSRQEVLSELELRNKLHKTGNETIN